MVAPDVPVDLTREQAARLAERELSDPAYRAAEPGFVQRTVEWLVDWVQRVADRASGLAPGGWLGILGFVLVVVGAGLLIRWRLGPVARSDALRLVVDQGATSEQYRARAEALARAGRWDEAVVERMRALVRRCQERGLIDTRPGWTADEVAAEAGSRLPEVHRHLRAAARTFDDVRYGGRAGTPEAYALVAGADDAAARQPSGTR